MDKPDRKHGGSGGSDDLAPYLRNASLSDPRTLSLVIFRKLQNDLTHLQEDLTPRKAGELICEGLDLLPGYRAIPDGERNRILLKDDTSDSGDVVIDIQDAVDSLIVIWNDYINTIGQS